MGHEVYVVVDKAARMPARCWGRYRRVAVVEVVDPDVRVPAIDARCRNVVRVVRVWERLNVGQTARCAFARAMVEAQELAAKLNAGGAA